MRVAPSLPEALAGAAVAVVLIAGARLALRALPDFWVLLNALAQPSR